MTITRRNALIESGRLLLGTVLSRLAVAAEGPHTVDVAYAGSMTSVMEGPIKAAVRKLDLDLHGRAQGASGLAQLIVAGNIRPDMFISVTPSPMQAVIKAGKAAFATPIARTEMVIAYSPKSRFASSLARSGQPGAMPWWQVLQEPGFRFGRTDPATDPQGRNIIFVMMLAARLYARPELVDGILGPTDNPQQIFTEPSVEARLQGGQLDAASAYRIQPGPFGLPYISLPSTINLSGAPAGSADPLTLSINGNSYVPEPLVYYAATLNGGPNPSGAKKLLDWLTGEPAKRILQKYDYGLPGGVPPLHV